MSGWEVIAQLKSDRKTRAIPIVVISIVDDKRKGVRLGADEYLVKPFEREALLGAVRRFAAAGRRLLVVDDDPVVVDIVRQELESEGWTVRSAANGEEALDQVERERPDVLLLDLLMPRMDGFETLRRLRQQEETRDMPVVVITAKDLSPDEREELEYHTAQVVAKDGLEQRRILDELHRVLQSVSSRSQDIS